MKKILLSSLLLSLACRAFSFGDSTAIYLRQHIEYLASDALEGRKSGSKGAELAAGYIARQFAACGLIPLGSGGTYFQNFVFITGVKVGEKNALVSHQGSGQKTFTLDKDFRPLAFSANAEASGPLVFAGYGISSTDSSYDDYANIDVKGKVVLIMRYSPEGDSPHSTFGKYLPLRYKTLTAREKGAKALLIVTGSADDSTDELIALKYDNSFSSSGIPVLSVSRTVADSWLDNVNTTVDVLQSKINSAKTPFSIRVPNVVVSLSSDVFAITDTTANVAGLLQVADTAHEYLVIGAHYDHLGWGGEGSGSLAPDKHEIHNGADDNASGTGGIIELARRLSAEKKSLKRNVLFLSFSGEEEGLLGSQYYVTHPVLSLNNAVAMINLDMVGRLKDKTLTVQGTGTSTRWDSLLAKYNSDSTFVLKSVKDGFGPSDHSSFYGANVPILFFFTGIHDDYHKPSDHADKINYDGEAAVVSYIQHIAVDIDDHAARPDYLKTQSASTGSESRGFRVYVGTVPDYSETTAGMKITAVRDNSPAAKGGLLGGDIIIKFGKFDIKNVYDYTYALQEYKPGDEVEVVVQRGSDKVVKKVKLEKRN